MNNEICVVGLGYVGLPLACLLAKKYSVIGFDINAKKIEELKQKMDRTGEVDLADCQVKFTNDEREIKKANFIIVAVPTPIDEFKKPDLTPVISASELVGRNLSRGAIVVYESTVYPGCTEELCLPLLEKNSGLVGKKDFKIGYSPERVNPADKEHTIDKIKKVVSGQDAETLAKVAEIYGSVITAGIHRAPSIKVAEAAKVIENIQRDLNIALMNELSLIFERLDINTYDVLAAAGTKWNFGKYYPGLVGGHCISVDPYYLTHKALQMGYDPQVILAGRKVNEFMAQHVADNLIKMLRSCGKELGDAKVLIMGLTFKEDVPDTRNSKAKDIIENLQKYGLEVLACDPLVSEFDQSIFARQFNVQGLAWKEIPKVDAIILFNPHQIFNELSLADLQDKMNGQPILYDLKNFYGAADPVGNGFIYKTL